MIPIQKGAAPAVLTGDGARFQDAARNFALTGDCDAKFKTKLKANAKSRNNAFAGYLSDLFTHYSFYSDPTVKRQLIEEHHGKCVFCECFIMDADAGDVEHFRPKAEVTVVNFDEPSDEEKLVDHPGYFWLSQSWENLFLSCKQCNQKFKGNFFDVVPGALTGVNEDFPRLRHDRVVNELPYLLDPTAGATPSPRVVIRFHPDDARAYPYEAPDDPHKVHLNRAARTIELVGLNRPRLVEARANHLLRLRGLFVLAAHSGGYQPDEAGESPSILAFQFRNDCAGSDAVEALRRAVLPTAEFSALAQDAIEVWNRELKLVFPEFSINHLVPNYIRVNTRLDLRLEAQLKLAEALRVKNATPTLSEAEPDTTDLDQQYNALLKRYQELGRRLASKWKNQTIEKTRQELVGLQAEVMKLRVEIEPREDRLAEIRKVDARATAARGLLAWADADGETRKATFGQLLREHQVAINELFPRNDNQGWNTLLHQERGIAEGFALQAQALAKEVEQLEAELKVLNDAEDQVIGKIEKAEGPLEVFIEPLFDIYEDAFDVVEAYKNRGADTQQRVKRAVQLRGDVGNLIDVLDSGTEASAQVKQQIEQNKGWPPRITKV